MPEVEETSMDIKIEPLFYKTLVVVQKWKIFTRGETPDVQDLSSGHRLYLHVI